MDPQQGNSAAEQKVRITLYWLEKSRAQRILWLLEELKLEYSLKTFKRQKMLAPVELTEVHPIGKSPIVGIESDTMSKALILAESGFIVEYLVDHFGPELVPRKYSEGKEGEVGGETQEWTRYRYFMHYAEGSIMGLLVVSIIVDNIKNSSVPFFIKPITNGIAGKVNSLYLAPNYKTHLDFLESQMATSPQDGNFLCGKSLTGADILMSFPLIAAKGRAGLTQAKYPRLWAYVDRLEARDAYKRAVQKIVEIEGSYDPAI